jgi:hypothetical protein
MISLHGKELYKNCLLICLQHTLSCIKIDQSLLFAFFAYVIFLYLNFIFSDQFRHIICRITIYGFVDMNYSILNEK